MLADSVPQPPQGSNCEWSLTRGAVHASREGRLEVVNNHYPVKSSFSVLNMSNCSLPTGCQGCKSSTSCKTFRKKKTLFGKHKGTEREKVYFYGTAPHRSLVLNLRLQPGLSGSYPYTVNHAVQCVRVCACLCAVKLWTGMTGLTSTCCQRECVAQCYLS